MASIVELLIPFGPGLLRWSVEAALLVVFVLGVKALTGRRWSARWHAALWLLLVLRLSLAWLPTPLPRIPWHLPESRSAQAAGAMTAAPSTLPVTASKAPVKSVPAQETHRVGSRWFSPGLFVALWVAGVLALLVYQGIVNLRLWWVLRKEQVLTSEPILELLESCKRAMGIRTLLGIVVTDRVPGPALFGFIRPRLLLPAAVLDGLTQDELRHVFLHELAHLKRLDIHWSWLTVVLQALQWFNPALWYGFRSMRRDRELACDELAMAAMSVDEVHSYGRTLLKLLEPMSVRPALPIYAALSEDASNLKRRITRIASFQAGGRSWWRQALPFAAVVICAFSLQLQSFEGGKPSAPRFDKIDYPFVDDPALIGGWRGAGYVQQPSDFDPAKAKGFSMRERDLNELVVKPGGKTSWSAMTWTKGLFLNVVEPTASKYEIKEIQGRTYLIMEWKSGDYMYFGRTPWYYVLEKDPRVVEVETRVEDKIDYPFVEDPEVHGAWTSVDFVNRVEEFKPGQKSSPMEPFLLGIELLEGGKTKFLFTGNKTSSRCTWTSGLIIDAADHTASHYQIKTLSGRPYLFMEWKNGDYIRGKRQPGYYVFSR